MIKRETYLKKIREFYDIDLIKVITGVRRCGKSVLLKQIIEELKGNNVDSDHIIYINFEDVENSYITDYQDLNTCIKEKIIDDEKSLNNTNKKTQFGAYLENVVYNELLFRGYDVSYGMNKDKEINFIVTKNNTLEYYQVTFTLADDKTENREFSAFDGINDNYPKYVISTDKLDYSQNGIIHKNITCWLLQ